MARPIGQCAAKSAPPACTTSLAAVHPPPGCLYLVNRQNAYLLNVGRMRDLRDFLFYQVLNLPGLKVLC